MQIKHATSSCLLATFSGIAYTVGCILKKHVQQYPKTKCT